jgi:hypothetical protein
MATKKKASKGKGARKAAPEKKGGKRKGGKSLSQRDAEKFANKHGITSAQAAKWAAGKRKLWREITGK